MDIQGCWLKIFKNCDRYFRLTLKFFHQKLSLKILEGCNITKSKFHYHVYFAGNILKLLQKLLLRIKRIALFTYSKSTIETPEKSVNSVQS